MRRTTMTAAALAVLALAVLLPNLPTLHPPQEDTGVFLYVAQTVRDGGFPYRDVWDHKPPLVYLVDLLGLAIAGTLGVWMMEVVALVLGAWLGYGALARAFGPNAALLASAGWLLAAPRLFLVDGLFSNYAELFAVPLQLAVLGLFPTDDRRPGWRTVAIGMLGAGLLLLKPTLAGIVVAIALRVGYTRLRRLSLGDLGRRVLLMGAGAAIPLVIVGLWLSSGDALSDAIDQAVVYNLANAGTSKASERIDALALGVRLTLPNGLALLAGAGAAAALLRRRREPLAQLALIGLPLELLLATASGRPYHYYFLPWLWVAATLAACAVAEAESLAGRFRRPSGAAALAALAVLLALQPAMLVARSLREPADPYVRAGVAYVSAHTSAGDTVLFWGSRTEVLFLTERRAPTRYVYLYGPLFTIGYATPARVDELLRDLQRSRPALIIDDSGTAFATPPLDVAALRAGLSPEDRYRPLPETAAIAEWVSANYDRAGTVPGAGWTAWHRR